MTDTEVHEALVRWISGLTNLTVIKSHQSVARPELPYIMIELGPISELSENPEQLDYVELDTLNSEGNNEIQVTPLLEIEWVFLVYAYGENASHYLNRLKKAVHIGQMQEPLGRTLNVHETGVVNSIPEFIDECWESRWQMNVMVRGMSNEGFVIDTIEEHTPFDVSRI